MSGGSWESDSLQASSTSLHQLSYTGERGQPFVHLMQRMQPKFQERRAFRNQQGKELDVGLDLQSFYNAFTPGHAAQGIARQGGQALEKSLSAVKLGWLPPPFPLPEEVAFVERHHPGDIDAAELLVKCFRRSYRAAFDKFASLGITISTEEQLEEVLAGNLTPQQYRARAAAAAEASEANTDSQAEDPAAPAAGGARVNPFSVEQQLITLLRQAVGQDASAPTVQLQTVTVEGAIISIHAAVSLRCFDFFYAVFGLAGEQELVNFYSLRKAGAQGKRSITQFAADVEMLYDSVQYTTTVAPRSHLNVFCVGLNSSAIREHLQLICSTKRKITMAELVREALEHEAYIKQQELAERTASIYAGRSAGKGQHTTNVAAVNALHQRRLEQETQINKLPAAERSIIISAFELAETHPKSSNAICQDCKVTAKPHTNLLLHLLPHQRRPAGACC
jgi:hypothetical protein